MDADQTVTLVVKRGQARQAVPAHQVACDEVLGTSGDDQESEPLLAGSDYLLFLYNIRSPHRLCDAPQMSMSR